MPSIYIIHLKNIFHLPKLILSMKESFEVTRRYYFPIFQMRKWRFKEMKWLARGPIVNWGGRVYSRPSGSWFPGLLPH